MDISFTMHTKNASHSQTAGDRAAANGRLLVLAFVERIVTLHDVTEWRVRIAAVWLVVATAWRRVVCCNPADVESSDDIVDATTSADCFCLATNSSTPRQLVREPADPWVSENCKCRPQRRLALRVVQLNRYIVRCWTASRTDHQVRATDGRLGSYTLTGCAQSVHMHRIHSHTQCDVTTNCVSERYSKQLHPPRHSIIFNLAGKLSANKTER